MATLNDVDLLVENRRSLRLKDGTLLKFKVLKSAAGYYIRTWLDGPYSRESLSYWDNEDEANKLTSSLLMIVIFTLMAYS